MDEKVRVCHISTVHSVFDTRIFYKECKTLVKAGYAVYLIITHNREEVIDGAHIIPLPERKGRFYRFFVKDWLALFKAIKVNARVYHFHDPELIFVGLILKLFGKKVIYDVHEDYRTSISLKKWIPHCLKKFIITLFNTIENIAIQHFDGVIFAEGYYRNLYSKSPKNAIELLNYPILKNTSINADSSMQILRENAYKLIYSGNISEARGALNIVSSFLLLAKNRSDIDLYLIGYIHSDLYNYIYKILSKSGLKNRVLIVEKDRYIRKEIIEAYYKYMDIGLALFPPNPHYYNKILTKFYEYMQHNLPIVASNFPEWKEFLYENKFGIVVDPMDSVAVCKAIIYLIENKEEKVKMGKNGERAIIDKYNWDTEGKKLLNLYKELLK